MMKYLCLLVVLLSSILCQAPDNKIKVHVVPHTHDDAGWDATFDEYFYGVQLEGLNYRSVKQILENIVPNLNSNKQRTFIYVEMSFFRKWWVDQTTEVKTALKQLISEGRFEFINGGYVMHDEAASYYQHYIDQMRLGLRFLKDEFDHVPEIAWFIDPFGHSASNAYILNQMGFTKIVYVRIDQKEKNQRIQKKELEFRYYPFGQLDDKAMIFTHITHDHYCPPGGMDNFLNDEDLGLDKPEKKGDLDRRVTDTYNQLKDWNSGYKHKSVLLMYGCDFTFQ
jgi:lysosomal alpha-mannosidase